MTMRTASRSARTTCWAASLMMSFAGAPTLAAPTGLHALQAPAEPPAADAPGVGADPAPLNERGLHPVARAFGRIDLKRADGTKDSCYGIFIAPGAVLTSLQGVDEAIEARMKMVCCGEFEVRGVLAFDEAANVALLAVDTGGADVGIAERAEAAPIVGDPVQFCIPIEETGLLSVSMPVTEITDWGVSRGSVIVDAKVIELAAWGPVLDREDRVCGFVIGTAGYKRSVAAPVLGGDLKPGPLTTMKDWGTRERSGLLRARTLAYQAERGRRDAAEAVRMLREAVEVDAGNGQAWWRLGVKLDETGRGAEAIEPLRRAAATLPRFSEPQQSLGIVYLKMNKPTDAQAALEHAIAIEPGHANAQAMLAVALHHQERHEEAIAPARESIRLAPRDFSHHKNMVIILEAAGREAEVPEVWKSYCEHEPKDVQGWIRLGEALFDADQMEEAVPALRKADELEPGRRSTLLRLAVALGSLERWDEGIEVIDRALALDPKDSTARQFKTMLQQKTPRRGK